MTEVERADAPERGVSEVARALKRLRERSGLSVAKMAKALGMTTSGYQHYEDRYKKPQFERTFLEKVVAILKQAGVPEDDLAELGDIAQATTATMADILDELRALRREVAAMRRGEHADPG